MPPRQDHLILPKGTRVLLATPLRAPDGALVPEGAPARVERAEHPRYVVRTPTGLLLDAAREDLLIHQPGVADALASRALAWEELADQVVLSVVVGSSAWGLAEAHSDEDLRGAFLLPFPRVASLRPQPEELRAPDHDAQYLEIARLLRLALDGDVNATEALWAPTVRHVLPPGQWLRDAREALLSRRAYAAFGRYALGQLDRMESHLALAEREVAALLALRSHPDLPPHRALVADHVLSTEDDARREVKRLGRALFDRDLTPDVGASALHTYALQADPEAVDVEAVAGAKNAYNLLRILHSGIHLLRHGSPLLTIEPGRPDGLRERLLQIKQRRVPLRRVIQDARELAADLDDALHASPLPPHPDLDAADALLLRCRLWSVNPA